MNKMNNDCMIISIKVELIQTCTLKYYIV